MKAIVVGAGPAGLASAACLKRIGAEVTILDRAARIGSSWRKHYARLQLHTTRGRSALPGLAMPQTRGRYPTKAEVIAYLEAYARFHGLHPQLGCGVQAVAPAQDGWRVTHDGGESVADIVVFATGLADAPRLPEWTSEFDGPVVHSSGYDTAAPYAGQRVLVVGFGNSGGDIALDLAEGGAQVTMSVRGPVNIVPKELFGVPITSLTLINRILGPRIADAATGPILRAVLGRPEDYGLRAAAKGPARQVAEDGRIPLIDCGTLAAIKAGQVAIKPGVTRVAGRVVRFADGSDAVFDAVIAATGYDVDLRGLLGNSPVLDDAGRPRVSGAATGAPGLYFCSYRAAPNGQLNRMGQEAKAIAADVAAAALD